jgi:hypothetical protein
MARETFDKYSFVGSAPNLSSLSLQASLIGEVWVKNCQFARALSAPGSERDAENKAPFAQLLTDSGMNHVKSARRPDLRSRRKADSARHEEE